VVAVYFDRALFQYRRSVIMSFYTQLLIYTHNYIVHT
jgi:hypothetical protein